MKVLADTHALIWWFADPQKLSSRASALLTETSHTVVVSAAISWELAIKVKAGKLDALPLVTDLQLLIEEEGFEELPIRIDHTVRAGLLPLHHRDPFDRLLVAQAQSANLPILSRDTIFEHYGVRRVW